MNPVTLDLKHAGKPLRPATAWLVQGQSSEEWLKTICSWEVDQSALRILPFSSHANGSTVDSLLVLVEGDCRISASPLCLPYGHLAERVIAPLEGAVSPPVQGDEWNQLLPDPHDFYVWHPGRGIIRFSKEEFLRLEDLFKTPDETEVSWHLAQVGVGYPDRLWSVASLQPIWTLADVEAAILNEITVGQSLRNLPPVPGEPPVPWTERLMEGVTVVQRIASRGLKQFLKILPSVPSNLPGWEGPAKIYSLLFTAGVVLLGLLLGNGFELIAFLLVAALVAYLLLRAAANGSASASPPPQRSSGFSGSNRSFGSGAFSTVGKFMAGIVTGIGGGFGKAISRIAQSANPFQNIDQRKREREVKRLLKMLETDPEAGLRFAIPFGGEPGRGRGPVGNELVDRFFASFGFPAGSTDFWNINVGQQQQLLQRYRDLAVREERAGRHRRAASIYSRLLGDWAAAAHVLKMGHHYAEAAALFQERLKNIPDAAKCYELAGMHKQAIELYLNARLWIAAGDLCARLHQSENAGIYYRMAVEHALSINDVRTAADLLENKLNDIDATLAVLEKSWPNGTDSDSHFELWFDVTARHALHESARNRIVRDTWDLNAGETLKVLPHLRRLALKYPQAGLQHLCGERMLELISSHLPHLDVPRCRQMTSFLPSLEPSDRLLPRDCDRYVERRRLEGTPGTKEIRRSPGSLTLRHKTRLTGRDPIQPIRNCSQGWIGMTQGEKQSRRMMFFASWSGTVVEYPFELLNPTDQPWLLGISETRREIWSNIPVRPRRFEWPETKEVWTLRSPPQSQSDWIGMLELPGGNTLLMSIEDDGMHQFTEISRPSSGLGRSYSIGMDVLDPAPPGSGAYPIGADAEAFLQFSGEGEILSFRKVEEDCIVAESHHGKNRVRNWKREFQGRRIVLSPSRGAIPNMLLMGTDSVQLFSDPRTGGECDRVHLDWSDPHGVFLGSQLYVVVDEHRIALFSTAEREPRIDRKHPAEPPVAVASVGPGLFSVFRADGSSEFWQL